jgi:hypothetical protein
LAGSGKDPEAVHEKRGGKVVAVVVVVFGTAVVAGSVVIGTYEMNSLIIELK